MIEKYVNADALDAREELLLVPVPVEVTAISDGFAGQVMRRYPLAESRLQTRGGLGEGDVLVVGTAAGDFRWYPLYSLVLTGIHHRRPGGWDEAPQVLTGVLESIQERFERQRLATAGIPGTGYSGLRNGANPEQIKEVLEAARLSVTVYDHNYSGDREKLRHVDPLQSDAVSLTELH